MNYRLGSLFQKHAHSTLRRGYFRWLQAFSAVFAKRQAVRFVTINARRYKRVTFGDSFEACQVEQALSAAAALECFPRLIHRHENELLLDYVPGAPFDPRDAGQRARLAEFLGRLYRLAPDTVPGAPLARRAGIDIEFLETAGVIDDRLAGALSAALEQRCPGHLTCGLDYVDPVAKNFVVGDDRVIAIDVESLRADQPLGLGIAKAGVHWLAADARDAFVAQVEQAAGVRLVDQMPFVELYLRVGWTKRKLLQGKRRAIRIALLEQLIAPASPVS